MSKEITVFHIFTLDGDELSSGYELTLKTIGHEKRIVLRYSALDKEWTSSIRGKKAASIVDNGNGVRIQFKGASIALDYCQLSMLKMLLAAIEPPSDYFMIEELSR